MNLASSVLETLRKATDEEYEEALARDAARSASDGTTAESAKNLVTVIINPKDAITSDDDAMSEASHVHEARCINPTLGRSSFRSTYKPSISLTDILNLPKRKPTSLRSWNLFDLDSGVGASNVNERVIEPNFKNNAPITRSPVLNLTTDIKSKSSLDELSLKVPTFSRTLQNERSSFNLPTSVLPKLRTQSKIEIPSIPNLIPKLNIPNIVQPKEENDISIGADSKNAASIIKERYTGFQRDNAMLDDITTPKLDKTTEKPNFKSSLNINFKPKSDLFSLKTKNPSERRDAASDLLTGILRGLEVPNLNDLFSSDIFNLRKNNQATKSTEQKGTTEIIPKNKPFVTEILDTVPSPSDIKSDHISFDEVEKTGGVNSNFNTEEDVQNIVEQNPMKTEIIDHLPSQSDINGVYDEQKNIVSDSNIAAKTNTFTVDQSAQLNNEMDEINEDIEDDSIISASDKNSQIEDTNFCSNIVEGTDTTSSDIIETGVDNTNDDIKNDFLKENSGEENETPLESHNGNSDVPLGEKIRNKFENLRKRSKINVRVLKSNDELKDTTDKIINFNEEEDTLDTYPEDSDTSNTKILESMPSNEFSEEVNIDDIQQMSDNLLDKEKQWVSSINHKKYLEENIKKDRKYVITDQNIEHESQESTDDKVKQNMDNIMNEINNKNYENKEIVCNDVPGNQIGKSGHKPQSNVKNNEMASDASENVNELIEFDDAMQLPLRQNSILQPISLSDFNLPSLPKLDLSDVLNINDPFKLADMFSARENLDSIPFNHDDPMVKQSMSASTSSFNSILPPLPTFEDVNIDILQLNPLSTAMPAIPKLNLNSFKTRLAIPESLQLKPLLLESSVGNEKGVIGASITLGADKNEGRFTNMLQEASLKKPNILRSPLGTWPSLEDLRSTMWENAQNLFSTPLETTSRNVVEDTLRSGQVLTENLRVEAENTVKDIHRNLKSTLKGVGLGNNGLISSTSFRSPNDLFEEISRRHGDVNDKLKGIQYDLSDRLETLRNNIFDEYRTPYLGSSIFDGLPTLGSSMPKQTLIKPRSKSSNFSGRNSKKAASTSNTGTKGKFITRTPDKNRAKMPTASSITNLKAIKNPAFKNARPPIFKALGKDARTSQLFSRDEPSKSIFPKSKINNYETNRLTLKKPPSPIFSKNMVKISFSTTELPPILKSNSDSRFKELPRPKSSSRNTLSPLLRSTSSDKTGFLNLLKDSSVFASEPVPSRLKVPIKEKQNIKDVLKLSNNPETTSMETDIKVNKDIATVVATTTRPKFDLKITKSKSPTLNKSFGAQLGQLTLNRSSMKPKSSLISDGTIDKVTSAPFRNQPSKIPPLSWPRTVDDKFLTKVREALRARLAGINGSLNSNSKLTDLGKSSNLKTDLTTTSKGVDMARSASDNIVVSAPEPGVMKENVSYSCKMLCTKNAS